MTGAYAVGFVALTLMLGACGRPEPGNADSETPREATSVIAAALGEQVVLPTEDYLQLPSYANADPEVGNRLAMQCRACHTFNAEGPHLNGPNLHGVFGRRVGRAPGFMYSPALQEADFVWTPEALDAWLARPAAFLPGNRMVYAGLEDPLLRDAVIAALLRQTVTSRD